MSSNDSIPTGARAAVWLPAALGVAALVACGGGDRGAAGAAQASGAPGQGPAATGGASAAAPVGAAPAAAPASAAPAQNGQQLFQRCATCHQAAGQGIPGTFPPLAGSEWATAPDAALPIRVVLKGLQGAVTVKGQRFNSAMPAYGTLQPMSDAEVAAVLTYVRSAWGNTAGAVTPEEVARERAATASRTTPWTAADLAPLLKARP